MVGYSFSCPFYSCTKLNDMKYLLIYSYSTNQYKLIHASKYPTSDDIEVLYRCGYKELRTAEKVLKNLRTEQQLSKTKKGNHLRLAV